MTDPVIERRYLGFANGYYQIDNAFICVSLAKPWKGFAYKVVASIITRDRAN